MVNPLDENGPSTGIEQGEQPVVPEAQFPFVQARQSVEVARRIVGRNLEFPDDATGNRRVKPAQVTGGGFGPLN